MHAFITPTQLLPFRRTPPPPRAQQRPSPPHPITPHASLPRIPPETPLKERSLLTFRGLSDLSGVAVLHELAVRIMLGASLPTSGSADTQLLFGGLIGIWTAAAFADRVRENTASLIAETRSLPSRWDAAVIYKPAMDDDDAIAAVAWLAALDEIEGPDAALLMRSLARGDVKMRVGLANALAAFPARSNVALSVLGELRGDSVSEVRRAAERAVEQYEVGGVMVGTGRGVEEGGLDMVAVLDRLFDDELVRKGEAVDGGGTKRLIMDAVAARVEYLSSVTLSNPDLSQLGQIGGLGQVQPVRSEARVEKPVRSDVPLLEGLRRVEVHGLCALALVPIAYELASVGGGVDLPFRFVGLGWLLTLGGLVAYPQSASLWRKFSKTLERAEVRSGIMEKR
eukprot:GFKZ01011330.1.p1 GENE.GFKZ01011330.1~~GFKZ01011330.1.p1  ORF type:complete len:397 (+),score=58.02 GFKZ01011330.1:174-1364(+)